MKNKKSKIIIPAMGLILLSTAASISGSVAWFTANRTGVVKAGEFSVVKTGDNLSMALTEGIGTDIDNSGSVKVVTQETGKALADSSVDHRDATNGAYITIPNTPRDAVFNTYPVASATAAQLERGNENTLSAFTWDIQFTVAFSQSASKNQGLFLNLQSEDTWMHEKVTFHKDANDPEEKHAVTAEEAALSWYSDPACKDADAVTLTEGQKLDDGTIYYKKTPDESGKGFRIAFIPTATTNSSVGYAKVWGANDEEGKYVNNVFDSDHPANPANVELNETAYTANTISYNGTAYSTAVAGTAEPAVQKVFMGSGATDTVPADLALNINTALSGNANYLGYFNLSAGNEVSLTFKCVAWFEGTHSQVQSDKELETMVTSMRFEVRDLEDAA